MLLIKIIAIFSLFIKCSYCFEKFILLYVGKAKGRRYTGGSFMYIYMPLFGYNAAARNAGL
jgi:hypothetical protein